MAVILFVALISCLYVLKSSEIPRCLLWSIHSIRIDFQEHLFCVTGFEKDLKGNTSLKHISITLSLQMYEATFNDGY